MKIYHLAIFLVPFLMAVDSPTYPYGPDISAPSLYIESGHYDIYDGHYAYDETGTYWRGSAADDCDDTCFIGIDFEYPQTVGVIGIDQYGSASLDARYVEVRYSDDCSDWTTLNTFELPSSTLEQYMILDATGPHRCWLVMQLDSWGGSGWIVSEMEYFETYPAQETGMLDTGDSYQIDRVASYGEIMIFVAIVFLAIVGLLLLGIRVSHARTIR